VQWLSKHSNELDKLTEKMDKILISKKYELLETVLADVGVVYHLPREAVETLKELQAGKEVAKNSELAILALKNFANTPVISQKSGEDLNSYSREFVSSLLNKIESLSQNKNTTKSASPAPSVNEISKKSSDKELEEKREIVLKGINYSDALKPDNFPIEGVIAYNSLSLYGNLEKNISTLEKVLIDIVKKEGQLDQEKNEAVTILYDLKNPETQKELIKIIKEREDFDFHELGVLDYFYSLDYPELKHEIEGKLLNLIAKKGEIVENGQFDPKKMSAFAILQKGNFAHLENLKGFNEFSKMTSRTVDRGAIDLGISMYAPFAERAKIVCDSLVRLGLENELGESKLQLLVEIIENKGMPLTFNSLYDLEKALQEGEKLLAEYDKRIKQDLKEGL